MQQQATKFQPGENAVKVAAAIKGDVEDYLLERLDGESEGFIAEFQEYFGEREADELSKLLNSDHIPAFSVLVDVVTFLIGKNPATKFAETLNEAYVALCKYSFDNKARVTDFAEKIGTTNRSLLKAIVNRTTPLKDRVNLITKLVSGQLNKPTSTSVKAPGKVKRKSAIVHQMLALHAMLGEFLENATEEEVAKLRKDVGIDEAFELANMTNAVNSDTALRNFRKSENRR